MQLLLARTEENQKPKKIDLKKIEEMVAKEESTMIYFDKDNSHKDLLELQDHFEAKDMSFYMKEVKYGLSDNEYMYEVHVL